MAMTVNPDVGLSALDLGFVPLGETYRNISYLGDCRDACPAPGENDKELARATIHLWTS